MSQSGDTQPSDTNGQVRALLEEGLRSGRLTPGSRLPTERVLAAELGASRAVIRQALGALEREGAITRHIGRGTFVSTPGARGVTGDLQTSPAEIMAARLLIEPEIASLTAGHATPADLAQLQHCLTRGTAANSADEFESWDSVLHRTIAQAAHNSLILQMFDTTNAARGLPVWGNIKRRTDSPARRAGYHSSHELIVEALADRDPNAARDHMRAHLVDVRTHLLGST